MQAQEVFKQKTAMSLSAIVRLLLALGIVSAQEGESDTPAVQLTAGWRRMPWALVFFYDRVFLFVIIHTRTRYS